MLDPRAYRRHLLARFLQLAGAGSAALAAFDCGTPGSPSMGGHASAGTASSASGAGGAGGAGGESAAGGLGGAGGFPLGAGGDTGVTVSVVCVAPSGGACPAIDEAAGPLFAALLPHCIEVTSILAGPRVEDGSCCYEVTLLPFPCYVGRTFFVDEGIVKADLRRGPSWKAGRAPDVADLPPATRLALAEAWARDGLFEHASVASFARFSMQLLALGAPADLVRDTHAAALDEIRHAELCLGLASAYFGERVEPAALPVPAPIAIVPDLPSIAAEVVMEGCIGETVATVQALDALAAATDPAVREVLEATVADETRHAELAWRFMAWALDEGGDAVREAALRAFAGFRPPAPRREELAGVDPQRYAAHGRQRAAEGRAIAERAMAEIVQPAMCVLLSRRGRRASAREGSAVRA
jgi:hypothetical protein